MLKHALALVVFACLTTACEPINRWIGQDDDWAGEEILEAAIRYKTNVDIDLTPSSPE
jgi:predicted small secreted protein